MEKLISILIPVYNAEHTLNRAIESCLLQTHHYFELIILDDASSDGSYELAKNINDPRIKILRNDTNKGIAGSRNILLRQANGDFITWLDADDFMDEERLEIQYNFLLENPDIDIVGTWIETDIPDVPFRKFPLEHFRIVQYMIFRNCIAQPTIMSRNFYNEENIFYDENFKNSVEDYELWFRLSHIKKFANLPYFSTFYSAFSHIDAEDKKLKNKQAQNLQKLWKLKLEKLNLQHKETDPLSLTGFIYSNNKIKAANIADINNILSQFEKNNSDSFSKVLISFYRLRLFKCMPFFLKFKYLHFLSGIRNLYKIRKYYIS